MDADRALIELAAAHHGLVVRRAATKAGVTPKQWRVRVARGEWIRVGPGVWRHALTPDTWRLRARAGLLYLGPHAALFGQTAAAWWELDVAEPVIVEFVVPRGRRRLDNALVVHTTEQWDRRDLLRRDGVLLTSVTRTLIDLASTPMTAKAIEAAIDSAIHQKRTSLPTLMTRLRELSGPGRHGTVRLRALLLDSGGESYLEREFLKIIRRERLPRPTCQVVHREDGRTKRVDFEFPGTNVIVEVSGRLGHVSDRERQKDARRRNALLRVGWLPLEFTTADVLDDVPYVVGTLRESLMSPLPAPGGTVRATQAGQV